MDTEHGLAAGDLVRLHSGSRVGRVIERKQTATVDHVRVDWLDGFVHSWHDPRDLSIVAPADE